VGAEQQQRPQTWCDECGAVLPYVEALRRENAELREWAESCEADLRVKRMQNGRLRKELEGEADADELNEDAREVFDYWKATVAPKARVFKSKRRDNVLARLREGATVDELKEAVDGMAARPYVNGNGRSPVGKPDQRYDDLEVVCRDEQHVTRFRRIAEAEAVVQGGLVPREKLAAWQKAIDQPDLLDRLHELKGWTPKAIRLLGLGLDRDTRRVVFPIHDAEGKLVGLSRYQPNPEARGNRPKMLGEGERDLFPAPETIASKAVYLVEGEPDVVSMRSIGFPAVGVPGVATWKVGWAERFDRFDRIYIVFDCDDAGRKAARERETELAKLAQISVVDLDPGREDGYDVGDLLLDRGESAGLTLASKSKHREARPDEFSAVDLRAMPDEPAEDAWEKFIDALEAHDCRPKLRGDNHATARCPAHVDRNPSLSVTRGDDGRVLARCHTGCDTATVAEALGLTLADLFQRGTG
jgi:hypothetical protein